MEECGDQASRRLSLDSASQASRTLSLDSVSSSSARSPTDNETPMKWENTSSCELCNASIGKRHLNPRHHCRVCGLCVCASCSPSMVQLEGHSGLQRACNSCVANAVKDAQGLLRLRSRSCSSTSAGESSAMSLASLPVDEAFGLCNQAIRTTNEECRRIKENEDALRKQVEIARTNFLKIGQRIHHLGGATPTYSWTSELRHVSLGEAAALCEKALDVLESMQERSFAPREVLQREPTGTSAREALLQPRLDSESLTIYPDQSEHPISTSTRRRCCSRMRKGMCRLLLCFAIAVVVIVGCLIAFRFFKLPALVQIGVNAATVSISKIEFSDFDGAGGRIRASITMAAPLAGLAATVSKFNAHLFVNDRKAAAIEVPEFQLPYGKVASFDIDSKLYDIGDNSLLDFASNERHYEVRGRTSLSFFGQSINVDVSKPIQLLGLPLSDIRVQNIDVLSGSTSELRGSLDIDFFSSGVLDVADLGAVVFTVHSAVLPTVELGVIRAEHFEVKTGHNSLRSAEVLLHKSERDSTVESELSKVFGQWTSGVSQTLLLRGPLVSRNNSLLNAFGLAQELNMTLQGLDTGAMKSALINHFYSIRGHYPDSGKACAPGAGKDCFRGSLNLVESRLSLDVRVKDMMYDVDLLEPLGYDTELHILNLPVKAVSCPKRPAVARLFSAKGMWSELDRSRTYDDFITLRGNARSRKEKEVTSFFLPGRPQPGQTDGSACLSNKDYDCCFSTVLTAAACYYKSKRKAFIPVRLRGNQTVIFGDFSLHIQIAIESLPIVFTDDIVDFKTGLASVSCKDFSFH